MNKLWNIGLSIILIVTLITVIVTNLPEKEVEDSEAQYVFNVNAKRATDFELPNFNGQMTKLSDSLGSITILNFWASWCEPCQEEAPHLQAFYEANKDKVTLLAINVTKKDRIEPAKQFVEKYKLKFPILLDETGDVSTLYGAFTIPTTVFLNANGEIVHEIAGPMTKQYLSEVYATIN